MYALFSKGFGKKGSDLIKNDFKDDKFDHKMTTKGKTADGTSFESNFSSNNEADFKVTHPVDDGLTFSLKTTSTTSKKTVEAAPEMKFDDNLTVKATFKDPSSTGSGVDINADYVTKDFSAQLEGNLSAGEWKFNEPGFALGIATDLPVGVDGLKLGLQPAVKLGEGSPLLNAAVNLAYEQSDYHVGINSFLSNDGGSFGLGGCECVVWFKASDDLQIAGKYEQSNKTKGKKAWDTPKTEDASKYSLVTCYNLSKTQTAKAKVVVGGDSPVYDFSLKTALEGKSSATFNVKMAGAEPPKFGFLYNLEY